jgi:uncharacterized integral membrane protein (TIGR00697 family)
MTTFWVVQLLPGSPDWHNQASYDAILGVVWRIVFASIAALFAGEILNAYVMARMKIFSKGKNLWTRMVGSSAVGSAVDTTLFSILAFAGTMSWQVMGQLIVTVFIIKIGTEIIISPLTMRLIRTIKRHENIDTFEAPSSYLVN